MSEATEEEIAVVEGIGPRLASVIYESLHGNAP
jgi:ERCC4-type nuclease